MARPIRQGLVAATTATAVVAVVLLAVPLSIERVGAIAEAADRDLEEQATTLAVTVAQRAEAAEQVDAGIIERRLLDGTRARVHIGDTELVVGDELDGPTREAVSRLVDGVRVWLTVDDSGTRSEQREALLVVAALGLVAVVVAALLGRWAARRLAGPIEALARAATAAGNGDRRGEPMPRSGIAEVDAVAEAMDATLDRVAVRLASERQLSEGVAHQLRNALTALRLQAEVAAATGSEDALARVVALVDRLDATIGDLTAATRRSPSGEVTSVAALAEDRARFWAPALARAGRRIDVSLDGVGDRAVEAGAARQAIDVVLDNAVRHGGGTVRLEAEARDGYVVVAVEDEGAGVPPALERTLFDRGVSGGGSTGLGLALARDLAAGSGGRLELARPRPPRFELWLPASRDPVQAPTGG